MHLTSYFLEAVAHPALTLVELNDARGTLGLLLVVRLANEVLSRLYGGGPTRVAVLQRLLRECVAHRRRIRVVVMLSLAVHEVVLKEAGVAQVLLLLLKERLILGLRAT